MSVIRYNFRKTWRPVKRKVLKCWFWAQKCSIYPIFGILRILTTKSKTITFKYFLMYVIRYNLRKINYQILRKVQNDNFGLKISHFPNIRHNKLNFIKNKKTITFNFFLMPIPIYNFRKIYWTDLEKSSKELILANQ